MSVFGGDRFSVEHERVLEDMVTTAPAPAPAPVPEPTTAPAPGPVDPWARLGDILAGIRAPAIAVPQAEPQTVSYVERPASNLLPILLILAAAGGGYYWYTQRRKK